MLCLFPSLTDVKKTCSLSVAAMLKEDDSLGSVVADAYHVLWGLSLSLLTGSKSGM